MNVPNADDNFPAPKLPPRRQREDAEPEKQIVYVTPEDALLPQPDGGMQYKRFVMYPTTLVIPEDITKAEWGDLGKVLKQLDTTVSWVVGEWAEYANKHWNFSYEKIAERFGYEVSTLMTYTSIVRKVPTLIRNQGLSFGHHRLVANMNAEQQQMWLDRAAQKGWTVAQMRDAMRSKPQVNQYAKDLRAVKKRVRNFTSEIEEIAANLEDIDRQEIAKMLTKLARKLAR